MTPIVAYGRSELRGPFLSNYDHNVVFNIPLVWRTDSSIVGTLSLVLECNNNNNSVDNDNFDIKNVFLKRSTILENAVLVMEDAKLREAHEAWTSDLSNPSQKEIEDDEILIMGDRKVGGQLNKVGRCIYALNPLPRDLMFSPPRRLNTLLKDTL